MKTKTRYVILLALCAFIMASCEKACIRKTDKTHTELKSPPVKLESPSLVKDLNYDGLTDAQINSVSKLFNEEICPCGCPNTFAQCLTMKEGCKPAKLLADWTIQQLKEGAPEHYLYRALSEEISAGYLAAEKTIDTLGAHRKGDQKAPFVIVEFADFECPACKLSSAEIKAFIEDNKKDVQIYFMHFPLSSHPNAERAAIAAEAAGKQGKFWEMHDLLFAYAGTLSDNAINDLAKTIFKDKELTKFQTDLLDPAIMQKIKAHKDYGLNTLNLVGTPTFMFNGRPYNLSSSKDGYQLRLDMEKARKDINCSGAQAR